MTRRMIAILVLGAAAVVTILLALVSGPPDTTQSDEQKRSSRLEKLRSVPYTSVTSEEVDTTQVGVLVYEEARTWDGYNLYCLRTMPKVLLMSMEGDIVHTWDFGELGPFRAYHAVMLAGGDVIALTRSPAIKAVLRLTWDSRILWKIDVPAHHEITVLPDSTFYMFVEDVMSYRGLTVGFSSLVRYSPEGTELERWSFYDLLDEFKEALDETSFLDTILDSMYAAGDSAIIQEATPERLQSLRKKWKPVVYDYFHPNTLTILPETPLGSRDERFRAGNLMICLRNVNQVAIMDQSMSEVLWAWGEGELEWPHHPTMMANGNILIFDNGVERKASRVIEIDPVTLRIQWEYGTGPGEHFYTYEKGSAQRLPNGNTLICDSDNGRALEVTRERETVWEWVSPFTEHKRRVQVYRMERLSPEMVEPLLRGL